MRTTIHSALLTLFILSVTGCYLKPEEIIYTGPGTHVTVVNIVLDTSMTPYEPLLNNTKAEGTSLPDRRFVIAVYSPDGELQDRKTVTTSDIGQHSYQVNVSFQLPGKAYRLVFWSDYVASGSTSDWYYNTQDLMEIVPNGSYAGNTDWKDAFTAYKDIDLSTPAHGQVDENIILRRPFAKYQVLSDDLYEYVKKGDSKPEDITVKVAYQGITYNSYDAFEGYPGTIGQGQSFTGSAKVLSANRLSIAWDYLWAEDDAMKLKATIMMYNSAGKIVNTITNQEIAYVRDKLTTVTGNFLTEEQSSGIGVITDYEGDIEFPLP